MGHQQYSPHEWERASRESLKRAHERRATSPRRWRGWRTLGTAAAVIALGYAAMIALLLLAPNT